MAQPFRPAEDVWAGRTKARSDLLRGSVDRVFALAGTSRSNDKDWRASDSAGTALWGAPEEVGSPPVPPSCAALHARGGEVQDHLAAVRRPPGGAVGAGAGARVDGAPLGLPLNDSAPTSLARFPVFAFSRGNVVSDGVAATGFRADYRQIGGGTAYALNGMLLAVCRKAG